MKKINSNYLTNQNQGRRINQMLITPIVLKELGKKLILLTLQILLAELINRKVKERKK